MTETLLLETTTDNEHRPEDYAAPSDLCVSDAVKEQFFQVDPSEVFTEYSPENPEKAKFNVVVGADPKLLSEAERRDELASYLEDRSRSAVSDIWWKAAGNLLFRNLPRSEELIVDQSFGDTDITVEQSSGISADDEWLLIKDLLEVQAVHDYSVQTPQGQDGGFQVIECGKSSDAQLTEPELAAIEKTLNAIDRFSGGVLAHEPELSRIITIAADLTHSKMKDGGAGGFATSYGVLLNIHEIRSVAQKYSMHVEDVLSVVLAHELLGHQIDKLAKGSGDSFFEKYFDYSPDKIEGEIVQKKHASITPHDQTQLLSKPVTEYGEVDKHEDLATVVDGLFARVMGLDGEMDKAERTRRNTDRYREELVLSALQEVVTTAHEGNKGYGFVGSPLQFEDTPEGLKTVSGRWLEHRILNPSDYYREEINRFAKRYVENFKNTYKGYVLRDVW